jgi:D-alanyl-D-alanine carboxypeptidase
VVLGKLIEQVSGQSYGDFLRAEVLDPLGMSDTGYQPGAAGPEYAVGHDDWDTPADVLDDSAFYAAGGMYSTVTDLGRWQRFLLTDDPPVVRADTLAELLRPRVVESPGRWYGYGIESRGANTAAIDSFDHSGGVPGYNSYIEARPATGLTVTVLANITISVADFGHNLAELVPKAQ